ncbi:MAG: CoA pyrophosphatase [Pseudomonadota bacterium]|nr:CoA pyrophosphatase [Pseudomonadota bacterium]
MTLVDRIGASLASVSTADMLAGDLIEGPPAPLREAAVLIAITDRPEPGVLLTLRCDGLRDHAGQIAFPGGRIDEGEDPRSAALREAWEELALDPGKVRIVGEADHYKTITGFGVTPVVALVPPGLDLVPNPAEVADWFEAPLAFLLNPANHKHRETWYKGRLRHYYEIVWDERRIWGATAAMIVNLSRRLA